MINEFKKEIIENYLKANKILQVVWHKLLYVRKYTE